MNNTLEKRKFAVHSRELLTDTVMSVQMSKFGPLLGAWRDGIRVIILADKTANHRQITRLLGTDITYIAVNVDSDMGVVVGLHVSP